MHGRGSAKWSRRALWLSLCAFAPVAAIGNALVVCHRADGTLALELTGSPCCNPTVAPERCGDNCGASHRRTREDSGGCGCLETGLPELIPPILATATAPLPVLPSCRSLADDQIAALPLTTEATLAPSFWSFCSASVVLTI